MTVMSEMSVRRELVPRHYPDLVDLLDLFDARVMYFEVQL